MPGLSARFEKPVVRDAVFVLGWFVVLAVLAAVLWWQLTPLAEYTRTATNARMDEEQLGVQVAADGWYATIAAVGGLLSGVLLLSLRGRDPVLTVVLVAAGAFLCAWLMLRIGLWLGPPDPAGPLRHAPVGATVPMQLEPKASGVIYIWPITALLGAIGVIWGTDGSRTRRSGADGAAEVTDTAEQTGAVPDNGVDVPRSG